MHYSIPCIAARSLYYYPAPRAPRVQLVEIYPINDRIRELCTRALMAEGSELEILIAELRTAPREHADHVRFMALKALSLPKSRW